MHVVALAELRTPIETEAAALAVDLETTAYEERLKLVAGLPAIVLLSADPAPAKELLRRLRARGQGAVGCDADDVVPHDAMVALRRFAFETDALVALETPGARLPFDDILAVLRATHRVQTETRIETTKTQFSAGRALLSGGLMMTKKVKAEETHKSAEREQLLYLFRKSGETPWILRERATHYAGLGPEAGPSSTQNFATFATKLRKLAPGAVYDERLLNPRNAPSRPVRTVAGKTETVGVSYASGVDLMAHLLALWIATGART